MSHKAYPGSGRKAYPGVSTTICQRGALCASGGHMGVGLGCYAEPKQGWWVQPVAKICFMPRPLYDLCDTGGHVMLRKSGHNMGKIRCCPS